MWHRDAVLVAPRDKAESVKALVEQLKSQNRREALEHRALSAVGLLPGRRQRHALSGQAHRGEAGPAGAPVTACLFGRNARWPDPKSPNQIVRATL